MKAFMTIAAAAALGGCVSSGGEVRGPSKMPADAVSALWSMKSVSEAQACLMEAGAPASYRARAVEKPIGPYPTIIVVTDRPDISDAERTRIATCL
ncbi:hypothetical protein MOP88_13870 [Sphingomonas sp. WKB10]|nr:hypothetical protein [Sphingomonas sp. WKB10]